MINKLNLKYENNLTPSVEVVKAYRKVVMQDDFEESLALVHYRGGAEEFRLGARYAASEDSMDRTVGADMLAQLGGQDRTFLKESLDILIPMLDDSDENVIYCACCAIGHRSDEEALGQLIRLADHNNPSIRYAVAIFLPKMETEDAINTLISLSKDSDRDVRNWGMFGLGTIIKTDTKAVRETLLIGTSDIDSEIRGEALAGLALRKDSRVVDLILNEWDSHENISLLSLEATEKISSPRLYSRLVEFRENMDLEGDTYFESQLQRAIDACQPRIEQVSPAPPQDRS